MKIIIFNDRPDYMGGTAYYLRFKEIMLMHSIEVHIVNLSKFWVIFARIDMLIWKNIGISILSFFRLIKIINVGSNIIYGSNIFLPKWLRKKLDIKVIGWFPDFQVHDLPQYFTKRQRRNRLKFEKKMFRFCDQLVVQNINDKCRLQKLVSTIPIEIFSFYEMKRNNLANVEFTPKESFILVAAQGWVHKRIDKIIEAYANSSKKISLVIIGKLHDQRDLNYTKRLNDLIVSTNVSFL